MRFYTWCRAVDIRSCWRVGPTANRFVAPFRALTKCATLCKGAVYHTKRHRSCGGTLKIHCIRWYGKPAAASETCTLRKSAPARLDCAESPRCLAAWHGRPSCSDAAPQDATTASAWGPWPALPHRLCRTGLIWPIRRGATGHWLPPETRGVATVLFHAPTAGGAAAAAGAAAGCAPPPPPPSCDAPPFAAPSPPRPPWPDPLAPRPLLQRR